MAPVLAEVIDLSERSKSLRHKGLVKPCTRCDRPADWKLTLTTGIDEHHEPTVERSCVEHLHLALGDLTALANLRNLAGDYPVLFPWRVEVGRYQR